MREIKKIKREKGGDNWKREKRRRDGREAGRLEKQGDKRKEMRD